MIIIIIIIRRRRIQQLTNGDRFRTNELHFARLPGSNFDQSYGGGGGGGGGGHNVLQIKSCSL